MTFRTKVSSDFSDLSDNEKRPSVVGRPTSFRRHCIILSIEINLKSPGDMTFSAKEAEKVTYGLESKGWGGKFKMSKPNFMLVQA
jgi:hypothetical protein